MKKSILVIPHIAAEKIKVREKEIAKALSSVYDVHYLSWNVSYSQTFLSRLESSLKDLLKSSSIRQENGLTIVELPTLHRPLVIAKYLNRYLLNKYIVKNNIDIVLNSSTFLFSVPKKKNFKYVYDFVDLPSENDKSSFGKFVYKHTCEEVKKADAVIAVSPGLVDFVKEHYDGIKATFIPNGATLSSFRSHTENDVRQIRNKHNLVGKFVIGCIGNFGPWMNLGFLIDVFRKLKEEMKDAALLIVGPGTDVDFYRSRIDEKDIIFTGAVPREEIDKYFVALDVATLPNVKSKFQDLAFHIKVVEYTAARKIVISSPLTEVKRLNFPNIMIVPHQVDLWVEAIRRARYIKWDDRWDSLVDDYDWSKIGQKLVNIIERK